VEVNYIATAPYQADPNADNYACGSCQRVQDPREGNSCISNGTGLVLK